MANMRITARHMLVLRASEAVLRKFLIDDNAFWLQIDVESNWVWKGGVNENQTHIVGVAWSPITQSRQPVSMTILGKERAGGGLVLYRGCVKHRSNGYRLTYQFTYDEIELSKEVEINRLESADGLLPGFYTSTL